MGLNIIKYWEFLDGESVDPENKYVIPPRGWRFVATPDDNEKFEEWNNKNCPLMNYHFERFYTFTSYRGFIHDDKEAKKFWNKWGN